MSLLNGPVFLDDVFLDDDRGAGLSIDTRPSRSERSQSIHEDGGIVTVELASIMTTASNPVSPGPSSPPLDQVRNQDFVPPTRPSSTPFPQPEYRNVDIRFNSCPTDALMDVDEPEVTSDLLPTPPAQTVRLNLNKLPAEIHECILDHLFGFRVSPTSKSSLQMQNVTWSWGTAWRYSRRKELSELALLSRVWRVLIQERLYRHIKLKATVESINDAVTYFARLPHLRPYVKHIEIWFPVFQPVYATTLPNPMTTTPTLPMVTVEGLANATYVLPTDNCSLEEAFYFVTTTFPDVLVLTLEGGDRKKAPKVRHFIKEQDDRPKAMPKIKSIRTLVCKGQWNLLRNDEDFRAIMSALPNVQEWHGLYSKPKSKSYLSMAKILQGLPPSLTKLYLCLEDYRRELSFPPYFLKVSNQLHFCTRLAEAIPAMEHLSYTGRICRTFFDLAARHTDPRITRLKSVDITVKNCCRHVMHWNESGSGITDMNFIKAFEQLVLAGIRALARFKATEYLRIRYVDLDSPVPPLNPYFLFRDGTCTGVWSDAIVAEMNRARPSARFEELAESFGEVGYNKDGRMVISPDFPRSRSLKLSNYAYLSGGISIT